MVSKKNNRTLRNMSRLLFISSVLILISLEAFKSMLLRGRRAQEGQFPWLIQFQTVAPCGGVLLSSDWVLTAAQCVQDKRNSIVLFGTGLNGTGSKETVYVKATYIFPLYKAYSAYHDRENNMALLKLTQPFTLCNKISLPEVASVKMDDNYRSCLIFGWQSYISPSAKVLAKPIQYSEVILNPWKLCTYMLKGNGNYTNVFCTMVEFQDEMRACAGNPGSPVMCENQYSKPVLLGIASWTNFSLDCGELPTYLDISVFRTWIHDLTFSDKKIEDHGKLSIGDTFNVRINGRNYTSLYKNSDPSYLSGISQPKQENIVEHQDFQKNLSDAVDTRIWRNKYTKVSFPNDYYDTSYIDKIKSRNEQYQEIGKVIYENQDEIMLSSINQGKFNYLENSSTHKSTLDKLSIDDSEDGIDTDFEFNPFGFEDLSASYSNTKKFSKGIVFFCFIFLYIFYSVTFT